MNTLFSRAAVVTMDEAGTILKNAYVAVTGEVITYVGLQRPEGSFDREIDCAGKVLMPGLVNAHSHVPMSLFRGYAGGHDLQTWLNDYIFPAEDRLDSRAIRAGTNLTLAEMIASGTTCYADMYYFCDDIIECTLDAGLSANIARGITCFDEPGFDPATFLGCVEQRALVQRWHGAENGRILIDASIHGEYTSFPRLWQSQADWAKEQGLGMHVHLSETRSEHEECLGRWGKTPAQVLNDAGVWDTRAIAAHCVWVSQEDMALLAEKGVTAVHNPVSNLKLGSGIADLPGLLAAGVNVALGTDGVSSNNSHDLFEEIKLAALLHKGAALDPMVISETQALEMATRRGAQALGRSCGLIEAGQDADIILLDFTHPNLVPCTDVLSNLVYAARGSDVCLTMARGRVLYENGAWTTIDVEKARWETIHYGVPLVCQTTEEDAWISN